MLFLLSFFHCCSSWKLDAHVYFLDILNILHVSKVNNNISQRIPFFQLKKKLTWNLTCPSSPVCPSFSSLSLQAVKTGNIFQLQYCQLGSLLAPHFCLLLVAPYVSTSCRLSEILIYSSHHISAVQLLTGVLQTGTGCVHTTK